MQLEFLGTGNCAGVPVYGCECNICCEARTNSKLRRLSTCAKVTSSGQSILVDAGLADLGDRFPRNTIDRIILSHYHIDHVYGLFPLRWGNCESQLPVHGPEDTNGCADLLKHPGILNFQDTLYPFESRTFGDIEVTALPLNHSKLTYGYALSSADGRHLAWLTDTSGLPLHTAEFLIDWIPNVMVLDCTFPPRTPPHPNHNDINTALQLHDYIKPDYTYLTHIDHQLDQWLINNTETLPKNMYIARDATILNI